MASIKTIRDGLKTRLATIPGLRVYDTVPGTINPPAAVLTLESVTYDSTFSRGSDEVSFTAHVFTSVSSDDNQDTLFSFIDGAGPRSVKAAVEGDVTLGGVAMYAVVTQARAPGITEFGGVEYHSVQFVISVSVTGL
jgi:hypothetical protein